MYGPARRLSKLLLPSLATQVQSAGLTQSEEAMAPKLFFDVYAYAPPVRSSLVHIPDVGGPGLFLGHIFWWQPTSEDTEEESFWVLPAACPLQRHSFT